MEQFEGYFRRADLDGDGKISGAEAVSFFQGSSLPKPVLAQIWTYADERRSGFLGRSEFYNALKLVTVAQSKRDLTPDIVKAALYGPAAAKIPPPHINLSAIPPPNPIPQMAGPTHNLAFRGPGISNPSIQYFHNRPGTPSHSTVGQSQGIPSTLGGLPTATAPPQVTVAQSQATMPPGTASRAQSMPTASPGIPTSNINISNDWLGGHGSTAPRGISSSTVNASPQPLGPIASHANATAIPGNGLAGYSNFGSNATSTAQNAPSWLGTPATSSTSPPPPPPAPYVTQSPSKSSSANSLDSLQSAFAMQPLGSSQPPPPRTQSLPNLNQQASAPSSSSPLVASGVSDGSTDASDNNQIPWPKMKPSDIQKYNKVFMEVDTDRDGKITGEQARNLFLSWRLPREVLKQVWDLSDQDSDSMLSVREFCFALYLMERYREGRPLPSALPSSIIYDETLLSMTGQPRVVYGNSSWGPSTGFGHRPVAPNSGLRPPVPSPQSGPAATKSANQPKSGEPLLEDSFLDQRDAGDHNSISQDLAAEKKVSDTAKVILDSREKIEYYRTTMQELVLYKSRCDNKLNEITERALADKREAELLGKKYEEKYKQVAEMASKLTIEEATFRDIQERKMELNQAIVNVEQGGSADGLLQVRADRIQSHLDELTKALTERSKKHGIDIKSATMIELPTGWQPGIQEGAAVWDEDWDKFEDEGFSNDLDAKNNPSSEKPVQNGKAYVDGSSTPDSLSNGSGKLGQHFSDNEHVLDSESAYAHSEDELVRSPQDNPAGRTSMESASQDFSDVFMKATEADAEPHRSFDDSTWGAFDTSDDVDSVWGFNPGSSKDVGSERQNDLFGTDDFGLQPIRTESPTASDFRKKSVFFEDSVPGTPASRFSNSPRYSEAGDPYDRISGFDSFGMHEGGFSPKGKKLTRFDSASSTKDFGQSDAFSSFDDSDPFGSSGPFRVSSDDRTSKKASENWGSSF